MADKKTHVTRTLGPIHFEDLDPHRFEDLVRELIYDFRDWQTIEATGRAGSDEGFDIRAYEKTERISESEIDAEDVDPIPSHPMEGNLWMIQGKREQQIGPKRIRAIVSEVSDSDPPYGYILAASANFSKSSYDTFREELRAKGVMEFFLWGKAELEDMLHLPKNDRVLFTFFGISLVSRRRSRATQARSTVAAKNKLYRALGEGRSFREPVLVRDLHDTYYPDQSRYTDFERNWKWKELVAFQYHALGLCLHTGKQHAYLDVVRKEWDTTEAASLLSTGTAAAIEDMEEANQRQRLVAGVYDFFPKHKQAVYCVDNIVKFEDIVIVDDKGDVEYKCPHIYVEFQGKKGPFSLGRKYFEIGGREIVLSDEYKRIKVFPDKFDEPVVGRAHMDKPVQLEAETLAAFKQYEGLDALFSVDDRYDHLKPRDIIPVTGISDSYIQITHKSRLAVQDYIARSSASLKTKLAMRRQLGREPSPDEVINVLEIKSVYSHEIKGGVG